ncbi:MAG: nuclear transport factor 2 family protein [Pseudomonadales bacterium]|jgi:hypothetical protein|nr:nuclear transport factor 2 family protein [Pseudomonadales bacterium]
MKKSVFACLFLSLSMHGLACEDDSVAIRYLSAIDGMNWAQMSSLLAENAHYTDPTMIYFDRPAIDLIGRDDIVEFWRSSSEDSGTSDIGYTVTACFETAGYHMVNLDIAITVSGKFWNVNKDEIVMPGKVISLIRVQDDAVIEHHDFVGYAGTESFIAELQQRYGTASKDSGQ